MDKRPRVCLALASALLIASAASAQDTQVLAGEPVGGTLSRTDRTTESGAYYDTYVYTGRAGERISISLTSTDFDPLLSVVHVSANGSTTEPIEDDDGGDGTDALLILPLDADGTYRITATSYDAAETGAYRLEVRQRPGGTGAGGVITRIDIGQTIDGTLSVDDAVDVDDSYYDEYRFQGRQGESVEIVLRSDDLDAYLVLSSIVDGDLTQIASNDDGAGGTDARLRRTLPRDGEYVVLANSLFEGEVGRYTLSLSSYVPPAGGTNAVVPIQAGQAVSGTLSETDNQDFDDSFYDDYQFSGAAGDRVTVEMHSEDFDTYLLIGQIIDGEFSPIESNDDDGSGGTDSRIELTLGEAGSYIVRANSLSGDMTGDYTLHLQINR